MNRKCPDCGGVLDNMTELLGSTRDKIKFYQIIKLWSIHRSIVQIINEYLYRIADTLIRLIKRINRNRQALNEEI